MQTTSLSMSRNVTRPTIIRFSQLQSRYSLSLKAQHMGSFDITWKACVLDAVVLFYALQHCGPSTKSESQFQNMCGICTSLQLNE